MFLSLKFSAESGWSCCFSPSSLWQFNKDSLIHNLILLSGLWGLCPMIIAKIQLRFQLAYKIPWTLQLSPAQLKICSSCHFLTLASFWAKWEAPSSWEKSSAPIMVYVSFSTSDLRNWKYQKHPFSEIPRHSFLNTVFYTHNLTWDYCQQLLATLFTLENKTT